MAFLERLNNNLIDYFAKIPLLSMGFIFDIIFQAAYKPRGQEITTPDFRQALGDTNVSDKSLTFVCRLAPTLLSH